MTRSRTTRHTRTAPGFTLVELLVCVAIIGILAAIAYPAYTKYLVKSNRSAAQSHLVDLAQAEAQYMADSRAYASSVADLGMSTPASVASKYTIAITLSDGPPSGFTITAKPITTSNQAGDGNLSIDSTGARSPSDKW